jgi:hypothetical protein
LRGPKNFFTVTPKKLKITLSNCYEKDYTTRYGFFEPKIFGEGPSKGGTAVREP